jgi:outer membrane protein
MRIFTFLIFFVSSISISGQRSWTLEQCIAQALENNLQINGNNYNLESSELSLKQAKHNYFPSLSGSINTGWNFGRTIDPTTNSFNTSTFFNNGYSLSTGVTLFNGGRIRNTINQAESNKAASKYTLEQTKRDIVLNVATAYLNALFAIENQKIAKVQVEGTISQLEQLRKSINAGVKPENDIYPLEAQEASDQQNLISTDITLTTALLNLKQLMRIDPYEEITLIVPQNINNFTDPDLITVQELYASAFNNQPSIRAAEEQVKSATFGEKIAKSNLIPSLSVGGSLSTNYSNQGRTITGYNQERIQQTFYIDNDPLTISQDVDIPVIEKQNYTDQLDQNLGYGFGVQMNIPIYQNYSSRAGLEQAKIRTKVNQNALEIEKENLKSTLLQAHTAAKASKYALIASQKTYDARNIAYTKALKGYDIGVINNFDLLNLKNQLNTSELNLLNVKYEYLFRTKVLDFYLGKPINIQ